MGGDGAPIHLLRTVSVMRSYHATAFRVPVHVWTPLERVAGDWNRGLRRGPGV
jgi:hypothetical protein